MEKTLDRPVPIPRLNLSHLIQIRRGFKQNNVKGGKRRWRWSWETQIHPPRFFLLFRDICTIRYHDVHTGIFDTSTRFNTTTGLNFWLAKSRFALERKKKQLTETLKGNVAKTELKKAGSEEKKRGLDSRPRRIRRHSLAAKLLKRLVCKPLKRRAR